MRRLLLFLGFVALAALIAYAAPCGRPAATPALRPIDDGGYDLARDEARGGHTLARHVGRSVEELRQRLAREAGISAASSFTDRRAAERAVARALARHGERIAGWSQRGPRRPNLALDVDAPGGETLGITLVRGAATAQPCRRARVVLRADGEGFFVLTAYPVE